MIFEVDKFIIDNQVTKNSPDYKVTLFAKNGRHHCVAGDVIENRKTNNTWYVTGTHEEKIFVIPFKANEPKSMIATWGVIGSTAKQTKDA